MADWIFQASAQAHDLDASIAASPQRWWGTPRYRDRIAVGDRVWMQETGPRHPGLYSVATTVSATYEHPAQPGEPGYARWRTDIRVDYRITPPLPRSELLDDATLGSFRPFHGFQRSNVPVPPDIAAALSERAAPRLVTLPRPGEGGHRPGWRSGQAAPISDRASAGPTTRPCRSPPTSSRPDCSSPPAFTGSKPAVRINRSTSPPARSSPVT